MAFPSPGVRAEQGLEPLSPGGALRQEARQLNRGAPPRVDSKHKKPTSSALEEIAAAKVE